MKFMRLACVACVCVRGAYERLNWNQSNLCVCPLSNHFGVHENLRGTAYPTKLIETFQCMTVIEWFIHCYTFDTRTRNTRGEGNRGRAIKPNEQCEM